MTKYRDITAQPEYDTSFWDAMKGSGVYSETMRGGYIAALGTYKIPNPASEKILKAIKEESVFRNISTVLRLQKEGGHIIVRNYDDMAQFVPEGGEIPILNAMTDFSDLSVKADKLAVIVKIDEEFVNDALFDIEKHLTKRLGTAIALAEDNGFINGNGDGEPTGLLNETSGAETGVNTDDLSFDDVLSLYASVDKKYRRKAVWLMNDMTALALRKLKDKDGNYLWNQSNDTILGKPVCISEFMPDIASGNKPIAFGDFSYYWIIGRLPLSARPLTERFATVSQIAYLAFEFIDGKLIRRDAVKVIKMG